MRMNVENGRGGNRGGIGDIVSKSNEVKPIHYIQAALTVIGLILNFILLIFDIVSGMPVLTTGCMLLSLVGYITVGYYCISGYQTGNPRTFAIASWGVAGMLFFQSLIDEGSFIVNALLILAFGLMLVFAENIDNRTRATQVIYATMAILAVAAILGLFFVNIAGAEGWVNVLARLIPWTRLVLVGTIALIYSEYDVYE